MAYVMVNSTVAAFQAIVMVSMRQRLASRPFELVSIATAGLVEAPKLPIWPMTWDEDCDGVLAIVGTAFLIMAPMVIWSGAFHEAFRPIRNRPIFIGWFLLLLVGLICAFVNEVYVDLWTVGQFRFCSPGNLPDLSLSSFSLLGREQPNKSFNESIWDIFSNASTSPGLPPSAFILVLILHGRCGSGAVSRSFLHLVHGPVPATIPTSMLVGASCLPRFSSSRFRYPS